MSTISDTPRVWTDEVAQADGAANLPETINEEPKLPELSSEEKKDIIAKEVPEDYKDIFGSLVELSDMAHAIEAIDTDASQQTRKRMLDIITESFIRKRMDTNVKMEDIKRDLLMSVYKNMDQVDILTRFEMLKSLHEMTQVDAQKQIGGFTNPMPEYGQTPNTVVNVVTGQDGQLTTNTVNVGASPVSDLKNVAKMNESIKAWGNSPKPIKPVTDVEGTEHSE
jgi:hypothetical protein